MTNRPQLLEQHDELCDRAFNLMQRKNHDYAADADALKNLRQCEQLGLCSVETGILVRITDKMSRMRQFIESGILQVEDESIDDTIIDIINYSVLLRACIHEKRRACAGPTADSAVESKPRETHLPADL